MVAVQPMRVLATTVIRSAHKGDRHGSVFLADLDIGRSERVLTWENEDIDWQGRGFDRGLRGIEFWNGCVILVSTDEILFFDPAFRLLERHRNPYLRHCHEISRDGRRLWLTSTGFDVLLAFDLPDRRFECGYHLELTSGQKILASLKLNGWPRLTRFDPMQTSGPAAGDRLHVNNVFAREDRLWCSASGLGQFFEVVGDSLRKEGRIPRRTHNVQPYGDGFLMNSTANDRIEYRSAEGRLLSHWTIPRYDPSQLLHADIPRDYARQAFGRGLCVADDGSIIGGSSPATISRYQSDRRDPVQQVTLSMDVREAIHGLEVYPY